MGVDYGVDPATLAAKKAEVAEREALIAKQATNMPATDDIIALEQIRRACLAEMRGPRESPENQERAARAEAYTRRIREIRQQAEAKRLGDGQAAAVAARLEAARVAKLAVFVVNGGTPQEFDKAWQDGGLKTATVLEMGNAQAAAQAAALEQKRRDYGGKL